VFQCVSTYFSTDNSIGILNEYDEMQEMKIFATHTLDLLSFFISFLQHSISLSLDPEYQRQIEAYIEKIQTSEGPKLRCKACQKTSHIKSKSTLINHIEATHIQANVLCNFCNKSFKARSYLKQHQKRGACASAAAMAGSQPQ